MRLPLKALPRRSTQSDEARATPAWTREPRHQGWESAMRPRAALVVVTGISAASQKRAMASPAPDQKLPPPARTMGRDAFPNASRTLSRSAGAAADTGGTAGNPEVG